jgi:hypothetical protein
MLRTRPLGADAWRAGPYITECYVLLDIQE